MKRLLIWILILILIPFTAYAARKGISPEECNRLLTGVQNYGLKVVKAFAKILGYTGEEVNSAIRYCISLKNK